jgi:glycosyltransferase involved in cell wall biosynthesis
MNILAVSHSCVTDINQKQFVAMSRIPGINVDLLIPSSWRSDVTGNGFTPRALPDVGFPIHQRPIVYPGNVSLHFYTALPHLRDLTHRPDIIFSTQEAWSLSGLQAALLARRWDVPYVFVANQNILKRYPPPFNWIEHYHYKTASAGIASSEESRQVLLSKGMKIPSWVVPFGTDTQMFSCGKHLLLRDQLGLPASNVIGYLGRLVPEKGVDSLLRAAATLSIERNSLDFKLLIVGSGVDEARLRSLAAELGLGPNIVFTGAVAHTEAWRYMQCMDILAVPSRSTPTWKEQFGRVLIESMACGIPVVGSDSGAIPSVINDTSGGLIFPEDDIDAFAAQLRLLLSDDNLRKNIGQKGLTSVRERYTYDAVAKQLVDIFKLYAVK